MKLERKRSFDDMVSSYIWPVQSINLPCGVDGGELDLRSIDQVPLAGHEHVAGDALVALDPHQDPELCKLSISVRFIRRRG